MQDAPSPVANERNHRPARRHGLLLILLGLLILLEGIGVFAILASQQFVNDRALRQYSQDLLQNVVDETRENAAGFLRQAQDSVTLTARLIEAGLLRPEEEPVRFERYLLEQLRIAPPIDALFFGDTDGSFLFGKRNPVEAPDGFLSKLIRESLPPADRVTLITRDADLAERSRRTDPADPYDPRTRPWYGLASGSREEEWTAPYIFYTSQQPGLTVARAVRDPAGRLLGVVGADVELSALSAFLTTQHIGRSGAAFIAHANGDVLAHPDADSLAKPIEDGRLRLRRLGELDAVTARAGSRLLEQIPNLASLDEAHFDRFEVDERHYLSMFVPFLSQGENRWVMGVHAPEDELAQPLREGQRESIYLGVTVSLLTVTAALLIALLVARPIRLLQQQASEDPLTALLNRRGFDEAAAKMLRRVVHSGGSVAAIMIDIDRFKPINDRYGHAVGDEVLQIVARRIQRGLSGDDLIGRYGGEEFAAVLPDTTLREGEQVAQRLRSVVDAEAVKTSAGPLRVSISLGVAEARDTGDSLAELLDRADGGLLAAKRRGRNRVVAVPAADPPPDQTGSTGP